MPRKIFHGDRLKQLRERQNLTQADLMRALNITQRQIVRYESGLSIPTPPLLSVMAQMLNCTTDYLLGLADTPSGVLDMNTLSPLERELLDMLKARDNDRRPDPE